MEETKNIWPGKPGVIPVTSGKADDANVYNRAFLDNIHVEMRVIDSTEVDTATEIFGKKYASPIMTPAFSHLNKVLENGRTPMEEYSLAAKEMNCLNWVGMEDDEAYRSITSHNPDTVRIIKPFADKEKIISEINFAIECASTAVGVDIDHVPGTDGKYDVVDGFPMGAVSFEDLKEYVSLSKLPFVAKGVLSVQDALKARDAGCAGIVVSHHHGRLPFAIAPLEILPKIKEAVGSSPMKIFVDCGMDTGYDAYKALALGADAVSVGRGILPPLLKDGKDGVVKKMTRMNEELREMMMYTGVKDVKSFDKTVLYINR